MILKKPFFYSLLFLLLIFPIVLSFQGIDFTDFGYWASCYNFIFDHPESVSNGFSKVYFSIFLGGIVMKLGANLGIYSIRLAYIFELYIIYFFIYEILSKAFSKTISLLAILISAIFLYDMEYGALNWLSYNDLTTLFFTIIIYLLYNYKENKKAIFFAGVLAGFSSFLRTPNVSSILFFFLFIFDYYYHKDWKKLLHSSLNYFLSFLLGLGILTVISILFGHFPFILDSFQLAAKFKSLTPVHNPIQILTVYLNDILDSIRLSIYYFMYPAILFLLYPFRKFIRNLYWIILVGFIFAILFMFGNFHLFESIKKLSIFSYRWLFWNVGTIYVLSIFLLFTVKRITIKRMLLLGLIFLFIAPLGSGRSLLNANFGLYLILPLLLCIFYKGIYPIGKLIKSRNFQILLNSTLSFVLLIYSFQLLSREIYRDSSDRTKLVYPVKSEKLKYLFTTKERADAINSLTDAIQNHITDCDSLLAMNHVAFANYLADCKPYLANPNPMFLSSDVFVSLMQETRMKNPVFPYIISSKVDLDKEWKPVQGGHSETFYQEEIKKMHREVDRLKKDGEYELVWENIFFQIFKSRINLRKKI